MNALGKTGLRTPASKKQMKEDASNREDNLAQLQQNVADAVAERDALQARGESTVDAEAKLIAARAELTKSHEKKGVNQVKTENAEETPAKKKRKPKAKKEESDDEEEEKPPKKARGKKRVKDEESDEEVMPAKKARAKEVKKEEQVDIIKDEEDFDAPADLPAPKKRAPRAKKVKIEEDKEQYVVKDAESGSTVMPKGPARKGRGEKAVKEEPIEEPTEENGTEFVVQSPEVKKAPAKKGRAKKTVKKEPVDQDKVDGEVGSAESKPAPIKRGRGKKAESGDASEEPPAKKPRGKKVKKEPSDDTPMDDATTTEGVASRESKLTEGSSELALPDAEQAEEASISVEAPEAAVDEDVAMDEVEEPLTKKKAGKAKKA
jgi:hypothetical protein